MGFEKLDYKILDEKRMTSKSEEFLKEMETRRTVRDFSSKKVPIKIVENCIKAAATAPSGANKQPWHFVIVKNKTIKQKIRKAAEKEEREFYEHRATKEWLNDLNQFGTNWEKPFLENAPYLIIVFRVKYDLAAGDKKRKNYYVNESVGIASGMLLSALHIAGLVTLTHTPSPMGFLSEILDRPKNESAFLLIPTGYPKDNAEVPIIYKKEFKQICNQT